MYFGISIRLYPRQKMAQRNLQQCARPMQSLVATTATDVQETVPLEMTPLVEKWQQNPPAEVPLDPKPPRPFATMVRAATRTLELGGFSGSADQYVDTPPEPGKEHGPVVEAPKDPKAQVNPDAVPADETSHGCAEAPAKETHESESEGAPNAETDVFHASCEITRHQQFQEKNALEAEKKKRKHDPKNDEDPEEFVKTEKEKKQKRNPADKKEFTKQKKTAEKAAKKSTKKAMKELQKKFAKEQKAKEKAQQKAAKAAAKAKAAKDKQSSGKKRKAKEQKDTPEAEETGLDPLADNVAAPAVNAGPSLASVSSSASNAAVAGDEEKSKRTFARRDRPKGHAPGSRWDAIKVTFNENLLGKLNNVSAMEANG